MTLKDTAKELIHEIEDASDKMLGHENDKGLEEIKEVIKHDAEIIKEKVHEIENASDKIISHNQKK